MSSQRLDDILCTHLIKPSLLRADNFDAFIADRASRLLDLIEEATGKAISGRDAEETVKAYGAPLLLNDSSGVTLLLNSEYRL